LAPERALFALDLTSEAEWQGAVDALAERGDAQVWLDLCFKAHDLSRAHKAAAARFEGQLRALSPAPLAALMSRLPEAVERAPSVAELTLTLIGARGEGLSAEERAALLRVTGEVREGWAEAFAATLGAPARGEVATDLAARAASWRKLTWLWGRIEGGGDELWGALLTEGAPGDLHLEALLALDAAAARGWVTLDERLLSAPAAHAPACATLIARMAARVPALAARAARGADLVSAAALARAESASEALRAAARAGDARAMDALRLRGDAAAFTALLGEARALPEATTLDLIDAAALLGDARVEEALVALAQSPNTAEALQRAAWSARRRSSRARAARAAQTTAEVRA
jgi:hypothetical protein